MGKGRWIADQKKTIFSPRVSGQRTVDCSSIILLYFPVLRTLTPVINGSRTKQNWVRE